MQGGPFVVNGSMWMHRAIQEYGLMPPGYPAIGSDDGELGLIPFPPHYPGHNGNDDDLGFPVDLQIDPALLEPVSYDLARPIQFDLKDPLIGLDSERKTEEREKVDSPEEAKLDGPKGASKSPST